MYDGATGNGSVPHYCDDPPIQGSRFKIVCETVGSCFTPSQAEALSYATGKTCILLPVTAPRRLKKWWEYLLCIFPTVAARYLEDAPFFSKTVREYAAWKDGFAYVGCNGAVLFLTPSAASALLKQINHDHRYSNPVTSG